MSAHRGSHGQRLVAAIGLGRPALRAWALYDWANSGAVVVIVTALFPIYFSAVASAGLPPGAATVRYGIATTTGLVVVALLAPLLGALADHRAVKKRLLAAFLALGAVSIGLMFLIGRGEWQLAAVLFVLATVGLNGSFVFYDALLPHVARAEEMDRVSTAGYAMGYVGGGLLLALNLLWIQRPGWFGLPSGPGLTPGEATLPVRLAFLSVALWWVGFSVPLFRRVPEPPVVPDAHARRGESPVRVALVRARETFRALRSFPNALLFLAAFLLYNDGIGTIIRMAAVYGTELGIGRGALIASILLVQFVGVPFAFGFGALASRTGAKRAIYLGLLVYSLIAVVGFFMRTAWHFLLLAILVGTVQGGTQALSRSLFASLIPRRRSGEFFGFFSVSDKVAGILGPALFAVVAGTTGSSRSAVLSVIAFFVAGAALLALVNVEEGQRAARAADVAADAVGARATLTATADAGRFPA